jgi:hypothetical protein
LLTGGTCGIRGVHQDAQPSTRDKFLCQELVSCGISPSIGGAGSLIPDFDS